MGKRAGYCSPKRTKCTVYGKMLHMIQEMADKQWVTPTHLWDWPKLQVLTRTQRKECSFIADRRAKQHSYRGRQVNTSEIKCTNTVQMKNPSLWYSTQWVKSICLHKKTYSQIFLSVLFIVTKTQKQWRYPSIGGRKNKWWYFQRNTVYHWWKNELLSHGNTWKSLKLPFLS